MGLYDMEGGEEGEHTAVFHKCRMPMMKDVPLFYLLQKRGKKCWLITSGKIPSYHLKLLFYIY